MLLLFSRVLSDSINRCIGWSICPLVYRSVHLSPLWRKYNGFCAKNPQIRSLIFGHGVEHEVLNIRFSSPSHQNSISEQMPCMDAPTDKPTDLSALHSIKMDMHLCWYQWHFPSRTSFLHGFGIIFFIECCNLIFLVIWCFVWDIGLVKLAGMISE